MTNESSTGPAKAAAGGLSTNAAAERLAAAGPNELPSNKPRGMFRIARNVILEPMFLLLLAAAAIYLVLGDTREAVILATSIFVVVFITIMQERRTEHALAKLRELSSPRALVIRDGVEQRIPGRGVVVGDILLLREGDRVPADAEIISATSLSSDESIVTGESLPADKEVAAQVYSGSLIVRGYGVASVTATGMQTQIGKIGRALSTLSEAPSPLIVEVRRMVRIVAIVALAVCLSVAALYGVLRNDWLNGALAGVTLAMGLLPEEFPVVLTIFLAMGAWRISRHGVLTRRMPAIEAIGAVTILAVDKTGTLTENRMRVAILEDLNSESVDLRSGNRTLLDSAQDILATAFAASEQQAFDPMEKAIHEAAAQLVPQRVSSLADCKLVREYDLTPQLLAVTHVWSRPGEQQVRVAVKGAPETVFKLCGIGTARYAELLERVAFHARDGLRVLAVAQGVHDPATLPDSPVGFSLQLLGLLCLADPIREAVPSTLKECSDAGIRVVMITGDHPGTALAIAKQAGLATEGGVLTGDELASMPDDELHRRTRLVNIYARTKPEHKLRLVQSFKQQGAVIAMTGDGVNDAPALKAAHIGVAMGRRGTDVAREAAALVLVDDDFQSLYGAIRLGRRIYDNIRHAMGFIVAVHIPIAAMGLLPVLFGWPLLLFPMHVLFLEFIIDPACSFVFETDHAAPDLMKRPPRQLAAKLFSRPLLTRSIALGCVATVFVAVVYWLSLLHHADDVARSLAFIALVGTNLALILALRDTGNKPFALLVRPNTVFRWISALTLALLALAVYAPMLATVFRFSAPHPVYAVGIIAAGIMIVLAANAVYKGVRTDVPAPG